MPLTLGERLRALRQERNLSLVQVEKATFIRLVYLQALENDERERLPSPVQGKGFVRVLAGYYGVAEAELIAAWEGKPLPEPPAEPSEAAEQPPAEPERVEEDLPVEPAEEPVEIEPATVEPAVETIPERPLSPSDQIFRQIGEELEHRRKVVNLTLEDVERFTRIRAYYLKALEAGRLEDLPSPVQGRGMLSNYARFLNLDSEDLLLQFAEALQARRLERLATAQPANATPLTPRQPVTQPAQPSQALLTWRRLVSPDVIIGSFLLVLLFGFILWGVAQVTGLRATADAEAQIATPPSISEILQMTATPSPTGSPGVTEEAGPSAPEATIGLLEEGVTAEPVTTDGTVVAPPASAAVEVYVVAYQRTFLRIIADGEQVFNSRTTPGSAYTFSADEQLELLTGNAAALQVFYNQNDLGSLGVVGQVVSMIFTPNEVITPTVPVTPTPAQTQTPTPTVEPTNAAPTPTITPLIP